MKKYLNKIKKIWMLTPSTDRIFIGIGIASLILAFGVSLASHTSHKDSSPEVSAKALVISTETTTEETEEAPAPAPEEVAPPVISLDGWEGPLLYDEAYQITENHLTPGGGEVYFNDHKETYYSSPGGDRLAIPGKHVANDGTIRDQDGYICVARPADSGWLSYGDTVLTSLGPGKVYDEGTMYEYWIDLYTTW